MVENKKDRSILEWVFVTLFHQSEPVLVENGQTESSVTGISVCKFQLQF